MMADTEIIRGLRAGDETVFIELVRDLHGQMVALAQAFVRTESATEAVVQETWAAVVRGIDHFDGRSTLRSWISAILASIGRTQGARDGRTISQSVSDDEGGEAAVDPAEFYPDSHPRGGHWQGQPRPWRDEVLRSSEMLKVVHDAIHRLPAAQRAVIRLRDMEGWTSEEACDALGLKEGDQRVLLHRARTRLHREIARTLQQKNGMIGSAADAAKSRASVA
jgi:RNA polymerase sigma-70 factor (ECF subfamily)